MIGFSQRFLRGLALILIRKASSQCWTSEGPNTNGRSSIVIYHNLLKSKCMSRVVDDEGPSISTFRFLTSTDGLPLAHGRLINFAEYLITVEKLGLVMEHHQRCMAAWFHLNVTDSTGSVAVCICFCIAIASTTIVTGTWSWLFLDVAGNVDVFRHLVLTQAHMEALKTRKCHVLKALQDAKNQAYYCPVCGLESTFFELQVCLFRQFFRSVHKVDYKALRASLWPIWLQIASLVFRNI